MKITRHGITQDSQGRGLHRRPASEQALTATEMLAAVFVGVMCVTAYQTVHRDHGFWPAVAAAVLAAAVAIGILALMARRAWNRRQCHLAELRERYRTIYRVKSLPTDPQSVVKREGAEIRIGDYGWEALPTRNDGLIHLQGLTTAWHVVWHAGFGPAQVERVAEKASSQYDHWVPYNLVGTVSQPPCPYPVQKRTTSTMGPPHHSGRYDDTYLAQEA